MTADRLVTVSPGYAQEITTSEGGWGLEGLLASRAYALNGETLAAPLSLVHHVAGPESDCAENLADFDGLHLSTGVLNGIDINEWNPEIDERIYAKYSADTLAEGKAANKLALQRELGLAERADVRYPPPPLPPPIVSSPSHA